jgi:Helix-loop-helix DNA-binding domain
MSPAHLPPTPAASGEFTIKESSFHAMDTMSEHSFALPPAALSPIAADRTNSRKGSMIAPTPVSPPSPGIAAAMDRKSSTIAARVGTKRAATTAAPSSTMLDEFNLPPPPTRSRKIIQMKPKTAANTTETSTAKQFPQRKAAPKSGSAAVPKNGTLAAAAVAAQPQTSINATSPTSQPSNSNNGSKRKQPSATSAAGRKIARKTAHSLIERRRRSKMNEEFSTLKDMIPACRGQEMHKLAILQVSLFLSMEV